MQQVITQKQAKQITGGRTPLVPVQYEAAIKALAECITLDDVKVFADKADALAAWAKIYRDDMVGRQAKALKLEAFRRMGELARQLRPSGRVPKGPGGKSSGQLPGHKSLLLEQGLSNAIASQISTVSKIPEKEFRRIVSSENPPSPSRLRNTLTAATPQWVELRGYLNNANAKARRLQPRELALSLAPSTAEHARSLVVELVEWLDAFEQALPKVRND